MHDPQLYQQLEQAEQLKLAGQYQAALDLLEKLLEHDPENITVLEEIADNELSLERFDRAETAAAHAVRLDAKSYTGQYILGFIRSHQSRWEDAVHHLKLANKLKANNSEILRCLGWALFHHGQQPEGIVTLERALNLDPESPLTLCDLGVAYLELRHFEKAKLLFRRVLEIEPDNDRARECSLMVDRLQQEGRQE